MLTKQMSSKPVRFEKKPNNKTKHTSTHNWGPSESQHLQKLFLSCYLIALSISNSVLQTETGIFFSAQILTFDSSAQ